MTLLWILSAILAVIFGFWAFAFGTVWFGIKILFGIFVALFVVILIGKQFRGVGPNP